MATMVPSLTAEEIAAIPSRAEAKVYQAFRDKLPKDCLVFHSLKWILRGTSGKARDGEADFLICAGDRALLIVEVKGGGIQVDGATQAWTSIDAQGTHHPIKNPFEQAQSAKYAIRAKLREHNQWTRDHEKIPLGHAVFFSDLRDVTRLCRPDAPKEIIGNANDLERPAEWTDNAIAFWKGAAPAQPGAPKASPLLLDIFARPAEVLPLLSWRLAEEERTRLRLTDRQSRILTTLGGRRRAAIAGGAGTGKTLIAVEKAKRLAAQGFKTLLTCYNRPLADHLHRACGIPERLDVMTFHQLCNSWVEQAKSSSGRNLLAEAAAAYPNRNVFDVHMPFALANAIDLLPHRYDAIVVDEGQDFREEYWMPLEMILRNPDQDPLYIFYDQNQNIYNRASTFPIKDEPFVLTVNCRNTRVIHDAAYRYFKGEVTDPPEIPGAPITSIDAASPSAQADRIHALVTRLIAKEKLSPSDIAILILDTRDKDERYGLLQARALPKPAVWRIETHGDPNGVLLETTNRFKGLEAAAVILWGLDSVDAAQYRELLYVATSRAKSLLYVCGTDRACRQATATP